MSLEGNATGGYVLLGKINGVPQVDETLSKSGWCADAKVTGDKLRELNKFKEDAQAAAQSATSAAQTAKNAAESAKQYAGERFDELADDVETMKTDVDTLKVDVEELKAGGGSGGGGGGSDPSPGGSDYDDSEINQRVDEIELRVESVEGDMSLITQKADNIELRVEGTENDIAHLTATSENIELRVENTEGNVSTLQQTAKNLTSRVVEAEDDIEANAAKYTELKQTVDDISFTVSDPINGGSNRYVTITLTVGDNAYTGVVMIDGNVDVSGQLSAEALYATLGDIARLKVDSLSTSRRIPMYLKRDKSDDNYIDISEQHITLRRAWTDGSTEQARDDFGAKLYWEQDIEDAVLGTDGYPYVDGARVFVTTEITDWPVMVYSYDSGDRLKVFFDEYNNYGPRMVWGEGDGTSSGKGRGYIEKLGLSFDIYNLGTDGVKRGVFMSNEFTDIVGQRRPTKIAFSGDVCNITLEGGVTEKLTFNRTNGVITSVTDSNGHTCTLEGLE